MDIGVFLLRTKQTGILKTNDVAHGPVSVQHKAKQTATVQQKTVSYSDMCNVFFMTELSFSFFIANLLKIKREEKVLFVG